MGFIRNYIRRAKLRRLLKSVSDRESQLADDEDELIIYDKETGKVRKEVVKKSPEKIELEKKREAFRREEKNRYPACQPLNLIVGDPLEIDCQGVKYTLEALCRSEEPEGADIVGVKSPDKKYALHSYSLFDAMMTRGSVFSCELNQEEIEHLKKVRWFEVNFLEDSRDYQSFQVGNQTVQVFTKYLGVQFFITSVANEVIMLSRGIHDSDSIEVPDIITKIDLSLLEQNTAVYDEGEGWWEFVGGNNSF